MKKSFLLLFSFLLTATVANAQNYNDWTVQQEQRTAYYTPKQCNRTSIWIDNVEFTTSNTIVNMHSRYGGLINLMPSTKLICQLKDGRIKVLELTEATIQIGGDEYTQLQSGDVFKAYFPALPRTDMIRIKKIHFIENEGSKKDNSFNITNIKISRKYMIVK